MIEPNHPKLSITRQCHLIGISRSGYYGPLKGESPLNLALMRLIDEQFMETPWYGSRQMMRHPRRQGYTVSRKRVRRLDKPRWGLRPSIRHPKRRFRIQSTKSGRTCCAICA